MKCAVPGDAGSTYLQFAADGGRHVPSTTTAALPGTAWGPTHRSGWTQPGPTFSPAARLQVCPVRATLTHVLLPPSPFMQTSAMQAEGEDPAPSHAAPGAESSSGTHSFESLSHATPAVQLQAAFVASEGSQAWPAATAEARQVPVVPDATSAPTHEKPVAQGAPLPHVAPSGPGRWQVSVSAVHTSPAPQLVRSEHDAPAAGAEAHWPHAAFRGIAQNPVEHWLENAHPAPFATEPGVTPHDVGMSTSSRMDAHAHEGVSCAQASTRSAVWPVPGACMPFTHDVRRPRRAPGLVAPDERDARRGARLEARAVRMSHVRARFVLARRGARVGALRDAGRRRAGEQAGETQ